MSEGTNKTQKMLDELSPSVQAHLGIIQHVIERMAVNSSACKTWCVTIVSAILVIAADKSRAQLVLIAVFPTLLFAGLDIYYLGLEKAFRASYEAFVRKVHSGTMRPDDLYAVKPASNAGKYQAEALRSFAIWGFYGTLLALASVVYLVAT